MTEVFEDKTLGQILIEQNIITSKQLELALKRQKQEPGKYLGQILFELGVPQDKINKALNHYNKRKPVGQILLDLKVITLQQLQEGLQKQKELQKNRTHKPLGILLVEMGYTTYQSYLTALSKHFTMPIISLENFVPAKSFQKVIGEKYAQQHRVIILENTPTNLKVALAEPSTYLMEEMQGALTHGKTMEFYLASPSEIDSCLKKLFDPFSITRYR